MGGMFERRQRMSAGVLAFLIVAAVVAAPVEQDQPTQHQIEEQDLVELAHNTPEFIRVTVDQMLCLNMCSGRGHCVVNNRPNAPPLNTTICICDPGWTGPDCGSVMTPPGSHFEGQDCPNNCSSHGVCYRGSSVIQPRCYCDTHYTGTDCSRLRSQYVNCRNNCSGFGVCLEGYSEQFGSMMAKCMCDTAHSGEDCSVELKSTCPSGCSGNGNCIATGCECFEGWKGSDCSLKHISTCLNNCSSHGRCVDGTCFCYPGYSSADCSKLPPPPKCPRDCSGHGSCIADSYFAAGCRCVPGWTGLDCATMRSANAAQLPNCPKDCSRHGVCNPEGKCECSPGWGGFACEFPAGTMPLAPTHGKPVHPYFMDGKIIKFEDNQINIKVTNEHPLCPNNCSSHGVCLEIISASVQKWDEDGHRLTIDTKLPVPTKQFVCKCDLGYIGEDCSFAPPDTVPTNVGMRAFAEAVTPPNSNGGLFAEDKTSWDKLPSMNDLMIKRAGCPHNCSSRGRCVVENNIPRCYCYPGYDGYDCANQVVDHYRCNLNCSNHGHCVGGTGEFPPRCLCSEGWTAEDCSRRKVPHVVFDVDPGFCPNHCSFRGSCISGKCVCQEFGWGGPDCSVRPGGTCEANCNGNGVCFWGVCECFGGYTGKLCDFEPADPCPSDCNMRGKCVGGRCVCLTGFTGDDCRDVLVKCPNHCSGHGVCTEARPREMVPARCECNEGWTGTDCSNFPKNLTELPKAELNTTATQDQYVAGYNTTEVKH
eukprot:c45409_g1_i1.p1 GENE.c45409_g1_i1~~c45409_g1_i1.p1  ORF type:complete len:758 (-),score=124.20 c45409_g1_i1:48-2321(-)